jgi:hypothetical protein
MSKKFYINYDNNFQWDGIGGRIPYIYNKDIKKKIFPILYSDSNLYFNSQIIINNKNLVSKFNLNNEFVFEPKETPDYDEFDVENLNYLLNEEIIINEDKKNTFSYFACTKKI